MILNVNSLLRVMCVVTKRLRLESRGFRYKVAQYLSCLRIKLDARTSDDCCKLDHNDV